MATPIAFYDVLPYRFCHYLAVRYLRVDVKENRLPTLVFTLRDISGAFRWDKILLGTISTGTTSERSDLSKESLQVSGLMSCTVVWFMVRMKHNLPKTSSIHLIL